MAKTIDTLKAANTLTKAGIQKKEAEAIVGVIADSGDEVLKKGDIKDLEVKVNVSIGLNIAVLAAILVQFIFGS